MSINSQPNGAQIESVPSQYDSMPLKDFFKIKTDLKIKNAVLEIMTNISISMPDQDHGKVFDSVSPQDAIKVKAFVNEYIKLGPLGGREGVIEARKKIEHRISDIFLASYPKNKESLAGQYDSESVARKFIALHPDLISKLNSALSLRSLTFKMCFSKEFLDLLSLEQRKKLSSLCDDLRTEKDRETREEKIKTIATFLYQLGR